MPNIIVAINFCHFFTFTKISTLWRTNFSGSTEGLLAILKTSIAVLMLKLSSEKYCYADTNFIFRKELPYLYLYRYFKLIWVAESDYLLLCYHGAGPKKGEGAEMRCAWIMVMSCCLKLERTIMVLTVRTEVDWA